MNQQKSVNDMIVDFILYLEKIGYSPITIRDYQRYLNELSKFLKEKDIHHYGSKENEDYLQFLVGDGDYNSLTRRQKYKFRAANALLEYSLNGIICYRTVLKKPKLNDGFHEVILSFEKYRHSKGISKRTIKDQVIYLERFQTYLKSNNIDNFQSIQINHILGFIKTLAIIPQLPCIAVSHISESSFVF